VTPSADGSCTTASGSSNSAAIAAALQALGAMGGGTLLFPQGAYCIASTIVLPSASPSLTIAGAGKESVLLGPSDATLGYMIQVAGAFDTIRDLTLVCNTAAPPASTLTSGIGLVPGVPAANVLGNLLSGLLLEQCTVSNGIASSDAIALQSGIAGVGSTENTIRDIYVTEGNGGAAIHLFNTAPGYVTDNEFANVVVNGTATTTTIRLEPGADGNLFTNIVAAAGGVGTTNVQVAAGADNNQFHGIHFDNGSPTTVDIANGSRFSQFLGTNAKAFSDTTGALMIGTNVARFGGYDYSSAHGIALLDPAGGVEFGANAVFDPNKTLSLSGPAGANAPPALAVGASFDGARLGLSSLATFNPPDVNGVLPATFVVDAVGRGPTIVSQDFDITKGTGTLTGIGVSDAGATIVATRHGTSAVAPLVLSASNVALTVAGSGLVLKSPDGAVCAVVTLTNAGALTTTPTACP
jgi:hypothetical protein